MVLSSSDGVLFFVNKETLKAASANKFNYLFTSDKHADTPGTTTSSDSTPGTRQFHFSGRSYHFVALPENSQILYIVLHCLSNDSEIHFPRPPAFSDLCDTFEALEVYGFTPLEQYVSPQTTLFRLLLEHATLSARGDLDADVGHSAGKFDAALRVYTLGATRNIYNLAAAASEHLLAFPISSLSDEMAEQIGGLYVWRLVCLQNGRVDALAALLRPPLPIFPSDHAIRCSDHTCDANGLEELGKTWSFASAYVLLITKPDLRANELESMLHPSVGGIVCNGCRRVWCTRVDEVVSKYSDLKVRCDSQ